MTWGHVAQGQLQAQEDEANEVPSEEAAAASSASYDYLLSMALWSLTIEKVRLTPCWRNPGQLAHLLSHAHVSLSLACTGHGCKLGSRTLRHVDSSQPPSTQAASAVVKAVQVLDPAPATLQVEALQADMDAQQAQVEAMQATTPAQLYAADLDTLEAELRARDAQEAVDNDMLASKQRKAAAGRSRGKGKAAAVGACLIFQQCLGMQAVVLVAGCARLGTSWPSCLTAAVQVPAWRM